jgi:phytol kinase
MAMTYGDAFASIIGRAYGQHTYTFISTRTIEGTQANFVFSLLSIAIVWFIMSPPSLTTWDIAAGAVIGATVSAMLEAISPWGTDNLSVPIGVSFFLDFLGF